MSFTLSESSVGVFAVPSAESEDRRKAGEEIRGAGVSSVGGHADSESFLFVGDTAPIFRARVEGESHLCRRSVRRVRAT